MATMTFSIFFSFMMRFKSGIPPKIMDLFITALCLSSEMKPQMMLPVDCFSEESWLYIFSAFFPVPIMRVLNPQMRLRILLVVMRVSVYLNEYITMKYMLNSTMKER